MLKALEREGHRVEGASDVDSALSAMDRHHFDLIVCDYRMQGKTGLDLLRTLKDRHSQVPVMMISAFADTETETIARQLGVRELLRKPVRRRDLVNHAARLTGHPVEE
jgi:DNA-binding response OmpR family regulator